MKPGFIDVFRVKASEDKVDHVYAPTFYCNSLIELIPGLRKCDVGAVVMLTVKVLFR